MDIREEFCYSIGDEVIIEHGGSGRIIAIKQNCFQTAWVGVEFEEYISGHNCNGAGKDGHCWYFPVKDIDLVATETESHNFDEIDSSDIDVFLKRFKKGCIENGGI